MFKPFKIMSGEELFKLGSAICLENYDQQSNFLVEVFRDGKVARVIESDAGEPEDQNFLDNFSWVPDILNEKYIHSQIENDILEDKIKSLQLELEVAKSKISELESLLEKNK